MAAPTLTPDWQEHFDFLLPKREYLRPAEVAAVLHVDLKTIDAWFAHDGRSAAPVLSGYTLPEGAGQGARTHKRIRRAAVILLLVQRANTSPEEWRARLLEVFHTLGPRDLDWAITALTDLRKRKA